MVARLPIVFWDTALKFSPQPSAMTSPDRLVYCFLVKINAAVPPSVSIYLEAIVPSLLLQVLHCRADVVTKLKYSRRVLILAVCGHIEV